MKSIIGCWKYKLGVCCHGHVVMGALPFYGYRSRPDGFIDVLVFDPMKKLQPSPEPLLGWRRVHPVDVNLFHSVCRYN